MAAPDTQARQKSAAAGNALPGGRYPIRNRSDLEKAIQAVGRAMGGEAGRRKVRRFIIRRARELGMPEMIPDTWAADGSLKS